MKEAPAKPENVTSYFAASGRSKSKPALNAFTRALLSSKEFVRRFSGMPAEIDPKVGGAFSMFGGLIVDGVTVELVADKRIVQAWRPAAGAGCFFFREVSC